MGPDPHRSPKQLCRAVLGCAVQGGDALNRRWRRVRPAGCRPALCSGNGAQMGLICEMFIKKPPSSRAFPPLNPPYSPWGAKRGEDGAGSRAEPPSSSILPPPKEIPQLTYLGITGLRDGWGWEEHKGPEHPTDPSPSRRDQQCLHHHSQGKEPALLLQPGYKSQEPPPPQLGPTRGSWSCWGGFTPPRSPPSSRLLQGPAALGELTGSDSDN